MRPTPDSMIRAYVALKNQSLDSPTVQMINALVDRRVQGDMKSATGRTSADETDRDTRARSARVELVFRNAQSILLSHLFVAMLFVIFAAPYIPLSHLAIWSGAMILVALVRWQLQRTSDAFSDIKSLNRWVRTHTIGAVVSSLLWSAAGILGILSTHFEVQLLAVFMLTGISAGAVPLVGSLIGLYVAIVTAIFLPLIAVAFSPLYQGGWAMGVVSAVFLVAMIQLAARYSSTVGQAIQSDHDILTNLFNRRAFERLLRNYLREQRTSASAGVLCYMDIDRFKTINDTYGHAAGDKLIRQIAQVMEKSMRSQDCLARFGGDEFAMLLRDCSVEEGRQVTERLRAKVEELVCEWQGRRINATVSIGLVAVSPDSVALSQLANAADTALYTAKHRGRNCVHIHDYGDELERKRRDEVGWVRQLRDGYVDKRLRLSVQEILSVVGGEEGVEYPRRYEMLLRLLTEDEEVVSAELFMTAAEHYGMTPVLDRWVLTNTLLWLNQSPSVREHLDWCAVNVSASTIADVKFIDFVRKTIEEHKIPAKQICFEISESALVDNLELSTNFITAAADIGCQISIDNFGSALLSCTYLSELPVHLIKIDGQFVQQLGNDDVAKTIVKAIGELGRVMDKRTVAECVEDRRLLPLLEEIGIDFAQGYGLDRPTVVEVNDDAEEEAA